MERRGLKPVRLISSDIDGTLAGDREASARFSTFWHELEPDTRPLLVYNSGRLVDDILEFTAGEGLPQADFVIGGVGTMMVAENQPELSTAYSRSLSEGYDVDAIGAVLDAMDGIERQPARYQHQHKSSWYFHDASNESLSDLEKRLEAEGLAVKVVYSSNRDLDILPANADKGQALTWLCDRLGFGPDEAIVAGDTGNDGGMFVLPGIRGIIPRNGLDELKARFDDPDFFYHASRAEADGVIEGLLHFRVPSPIRS